MQSAAGVKYFFSMVILFLIFQNDQHIAAMTNQHNFCLTSSESLRWGPQPLLGSSRSSAAPSHMPTWILLGRNGKRCGLSPQTLRTSYTPLWTAHVSSRFWLEWVNSISLGLFIAPRKKYCWHNSNNYINEEIMFAVIKHIISMVFELWHISISTKWQLFG
jgi:hypothetical protein